MLLKRIFTPFVLIFTLILVAFTSYIGLRLATHPAHWALLWMSALLIWLLPVVHWASDKESYERHEIWLQQASFVAMGLMSWVLVITVARDFVLAFGHVLGARSLGPVTAGTPALALATVLSGVGAWRALVATPRVREVRVPIEGLPPALDGFRIAQLSDLHVGATIGRAYVERVVGAVRALKPDLTVLTGDIVDGNLADLASDVEPLRALEPRGRVFYVPGNHEYYWTISDWLPKIASLGARALLNGGAAVEHRGARVWVGGITDPAAGRVQGPDVGQAARGGENADFRLLLSHRPDAIEEAARAGFQLQLSGHTHGGQFFPWTYVVRFVHRYYAGLRKHGPAWIYVSPGTGTWGPPVRIGTTSEITCLVLASSSV